MLSPRSKQLLYACWGGRGGDQSQTSLGGSKSKKYTDVYVLSDQNVLHCMEADVFLTPSEENLGR